MQLNKPQNTSTRARLCTRHSTRDCLHTNATNNAKFEAFSSVARSDWYNSDAKTGATTGATRVKNVTVLKFNRVAHRDVALVCFALNASNFHWKVLAEDSNCSHYKSAETAFWLMLRRVDVLKAKEHLCWWFMLSSDNERGGLWKKWFH